VFRDRPQFAVLLAEIANLWNLFELDLIELFTLCLNTDRNTAAKLLAAMHTLSPRLQLIRVAVESTLSEELSNEFVANIDTIRRRHTERSRVVHGLWSIPLETVPPWLPKTKVDSCLILTEPPGPAYFSRQYLYTQQDFIHAAQRILALRNWCDDYLNRVREFLRGWKGGSPAS
jgi:hypothetical protein